MGMHASATCSVSYGEDGPCRAWIIGEENQGIQVMFKLMNHARLGVGMQGMSQASAAYQLALDYAHERIQGVRVENMKDPSAPRVPIVEHPDVRRLLMTQKAIVEATRCLVYTCAFWLDQVRNTNDEDERERLNNLVELLTPVCKAYSTEMGFQSTCHALQVHGGYGYCEEYGVSVLVRDAKIGTIYEGTTGIQALDLLGRKVSMRSGALFMGFVTLLTDFAKKHRDHPELGKHVAWLDEAKDTLAQTTMTLGTKAMSGNPGYPVLYATPYSFMFGHVACSYFLLHQAMVAYDKLQQLYSEADVKGAEGKKVFLERHPDAKYYFNKVQTAKFFVTNILPGVYGIAKSVDSDDMSPIEAIF